MIAPGETSLEALKPGTLEILELSGLFIDAHSCTFSSEIRLALFHSPEGPSPIKGGSLSGSLTSFQDMKLASTMIRTSEMASGVPYGYYGPTHARIHASIVRNQ